MNESPLRLHDSLAPQEQARACVYALLASLLLGVRPATLAALRESARPEGDAPVAREWAHLVHEANVRSPAQVAAEFDELFRAAGTPRINPYGSLYLAGAMMEKPLAALRSDLRRLGLARLPGATELEDHLGGLCEAMCLLIVQQRGLAAEHAFFARHLQGWYQRCLADLEAAAAGGFYAALARLAQAFFDMEEQAFELAGSEHAVAEATA